MKKISWIYTIKYCLYLAWKASKKYTIIRIVIKFTLPIIAILVSYLIANITNILSGQVLIGKSETIFLFFMVLLLCMKILSLAFNKIHTYISQNHNELLDREINLKIMDICINSDIEMYDNPEYYDHLEIIHRDSQAIVNILWSVLDFISALLSFGGVLAIICNGEPLFALIITVSAIPVAIVSHHFTKKNYDLSVKQANEEREKFYYTAISSQKSYSQIIRINKMGEWIKRKYHNLWKKLFLERKQLHKKNYIYDVLVKAIPEIVIGGALINVGLKVIQGIYLVGDYALYTGLFTQLYTQITMAVENAIDVYDNKIKIENILTFNQAPCKIVSGECSLNEIETIEFRNVYFSYPGTDVEVLKSVSFKIKKGEKIALVGLNGSGKTTILKLILRFYDPTVGEILINGINIKKYKLDYLRMCMDCYSQNSINLPFSVRKNVNTRDNNQYLNNDMGIIKAMEYAHAKDVLKECGGNLSRYISRFFSDEGIELSEGQHQKVAISRVFFSNRKFVIFDEPSSSLDPEAEDKIFKSIEFLFDEKTVFFTSHRLTNLFLADKILVLEKGKIIENGTKDELMKKKGRFYSLYQYQAEKFVTSDFV